MRIHMHVCSQKKKSPIWEKIFVYVYINQNNLLYDVLSNHRKFINKHLHNILTVNLLTPKLINRNKKKIFIIAKLMWNIWNLMILRKIWNNLKINSFGFLNLKINNLYIYYYSYWFISIVLLTGITLKFKIGFLCVNKRKIRNKFYIYFVWYKIASASLVYLNFYFKGMFFKERRVRWYWIL